MQTGLDAQKVLEGHERLLQRNLVDLPRPFGVHTIYGHTINTFSLYISLRRPRTHPHVTAKIIHGTLSPALFLFWAIQGLASLQQLRPREPIRVGERAVRIREGGARTRRGDAAPAQRVPRARGATREPTPAGMYMCIETFSAHGSRL